MGSFMTCLLEPASDLMYPLPNSLLGSFCSGSACTACNQDDPGLEQGGRSILQFLSSPHPPSPAFFFPFLSGCLACVASYLLWDPRKEQESSSPIKRKKMVVGSELL